MFHLKAIEASGVVELVSISDKGGEQLAEVKGATGVGHACGDYHELLAKPEVEAVAINTPPSWARRASRRRRATARSRVRSEAATRRSALKSGEGRRE